MSLFVVWSEDLTALNFNRKCWWKRGPILSEIEPLKKTIGYFHTEKDARIAAKKYLVIEKDIFGFVWKYYIDYGPVEFYKIFPYIYEFPDFEKRFRNAKEPNLEFMFDLINISYFYDFVNFNGNVSIHIEELR